MNVEKLSLFTKQYKNSLGAADVNFYLSQHRPGHNYHKNDPIAKFENAGRMIILLVDFSLHTPQMIETLP